MTASRVLAGKGEAAAVSGASLSEFQQSLVDFTPRLDTGESPRMRVLRLARKIDDEHDAAVHLRDTAARFLGDV